MAGDRDEHQRDVPWVYSRLGVRPIIHAAGTESPPGGTRMPAEVLEAMAEASRAFVMVEELNAAVGRQIADATGAEAGYVTSGSAGGMLLAVAACIAGTDPEKIEHLPHSEGMANEVIIHQAHRVNFDKMFQAAGGRFVEIGVAGTPAERSDLEDAINERTACVAYIDSPLVSPGALDFHSVVEIAHARGIPVIVDAASTLPPVSHLRRWIEWGADLVIYSGGKGIRGPQNTGLLAGRADLIEAAAANGFPHQGAIGRAGKVSKEDMAGLSVALDLFLKQDHDREFEEHRQQAEIIKDALSQRSDVEVELVADPSKSPAPVVNLSPAGGADWTPESLKVELMHGEPSIYCKHSPQALKIGTHSLQSGEPELIADSVARVLDHLHAKV